MKAAIWALGLKENIPQNFVITLLACNDRKVVDAFHSAVKKTLKNKINHKKKTKVIKIFNEYLSNHLAANLPLQTKLTINHIASLRNAGLQSVDMFSWGVYRKYESNDLD